MADAEFIANTTSFDEGDLNATSPPDFYRTDAERITLATILFSTSTIGIIGNTAVIVAVCITKTLQTSINVFVINLAVADFVTCIDAILQGVTFLSDLPVFPDAVCQAMAFGILVCIGCSLNTLAGIAINRVVGITTKIQSRFRKLYSPATMVVMVGLTWVVPLIIAIIPLVSDYGALGYNPAYDTCTWRSNRMYSPRYSMVLGATYFPVQFLILIVCYLKIYLYVRATTRSTLRQDRAGGDGTGNVALQNQLWKRKVAVVKNLFLVVCVFFICICPYFLFILLLPDKIVVKILPFGSAILMANSCLNPIIYGAKHPDFRQVFARFVCCRASRKQKTSATQSTQLTSKPEVGPSSAGVSAISKQSSM